MRGIAAAVLVLATVATSAKGPPQIFSTPLSPRIVRCAIHVKLDPKTHKLAGRERVIWRNTTADTVSEAKFHLYLNAFANDRTVFMRESHGWHRDFGAKDASYGYCRVTSIALVDPDGGTPLPLNPEYPGEDRTVMRVALPRPVPPGGEASFDVVFDDLLPSVFARSGWEGDYYMVGQWFPKLGVYQEGRGWNCHPYHLNSEFFADFAVYDVDITTPARFVVGATGVEWGRSAKGGEVTRRYHAEDIHDFAWTAYPGFVEVKDRWKRAGAKVDIRLLMLPGDLAHAPRYARALKAALDWTADHLVPFPYPNFTVVDPGLNGSAGMEYPTLVTAGTHPAIPPSLVMPELVIVHEFAHNYFQGMSANNEFEEAWLDEGFASYLEMRILEAMYGKDRSYLAGFLGWNASSEGMQRATYLQMPDTDPVVKASWAYSGNGSYGVISYAKSALVLRTLEGLVGRSTFDRILKAFFDRVQFTHTTTADFEAAFHAGAGPEWDSLLRSLLVSTATVDYEVVSVRNSKAKARAGYFEEGGKWTLLEPDKPAEDGGVRPPKKSGANPGVAEHGPKASKTPKERTTLSEVKVGRIGDLVIPVQVKVTFEGGVTRTEVWDGRGRWKRYTYTGPEVVRVEVDPGGKIPLDLDRLNNGWVAKPDPLPARSLVTRMRILVQGAMVALLNIL